MKRRAFDPWATCAAYLLAALFVAVLWADAGNRYAWMRDMDPMVTTLPVDADAAFRLTLLGAAAAALALLGLWRARAIESRYGRRAALGAGALLLGLTALKVLLLL